MDKYHTYFRFLYWWYIDNSKKERIVNFFDKNSWKKVAVYGIGMMGELIVRDLKLLGINVLYGIDKNPDNVFFDLDIYTLEDELPCVDIIIITPFLDYEEINERITEKIGTKNINVISIDKLMHECI